MRKKKKSLCIFNKVQNIKRSVDICPWKYCLNIQFPFRWCVSLCNKELFSIFEGFEFLIKSSNDTWTLQFILSILTFQLPLVIRKITLCWKLNFKFFLLFSLLFVPSLSKRHHHIITYLHDLKGFFFFSFTSKTKRPEQF